MQTILIPTDFKPTSLECIPGLCEQLEGKELSLVFVHIFKLSDSIHDLLMLSKRTKEYEDIPEEFYERLMELKRTHKQLKTIQVEFFYGSTLSAFRNFLEANEVKLILDISDCSVSKINNSSIDPSLFITKCDFPLISANGNSRCRVGPN